MTTRTKAYQVPNPTNDGFFADMGCCGTRSLRWADAHDPTPATPAEASCIFYQGEWYYDSGKRGGELREGNGGSREFQNVEADGMRLWADNTGLIIED